MRLRILHETVYRYDMPVRNVIQTLRLTPRSHDGQHVLNWRIDLSENSLLDQDEDAFGNITHVFSAEGPLQQLSVLVEGEIETQDTGGMVRGTIERFPPSFYLRETPLTQPDDAILSYARGLDQGAGGNRLTFLHALLTGLRGDLVYDLKATGTATSAAGAFALKRGVCQDFAHIFIAAARSRGVPTRYVGGHFRRNDGVTSQQAGHAWAEAHVPDLGWVAFDPANGICATEAHVRVAVGLDYQGAAPVRGSRQGGGKEAMVVAVNVDQAQRQTQN
jgi:transglutaminase-like putative cysteine protease